MKLTANSILHRSRSVFVTAIFACSFLSNSFVASAAGGGGGGGGGFSSPSHTGPSFDPVAKYQEGITALQSGENRKAEKAFRKVISVNKKHAKSQYFLGLALYEQEKFKKAKRPFQKALRYDDKLFSAHGYLGVIFKKTNKAEKAESHHQSLLKLKAECGECKDKANIERALMRLNEQAQQSRIEFNTTLEAGDKAYIDAVSLINKGEYQQALLSLETSADAFGPHPDILTYQGFANRKLGNKDLALEFYRAALAVDAEHRGANEYLGEYYVEVGQIDMAKKQLSKLESICSFGCEEAEELRRWINAAS